GAWAATAFIGERWWLSDLMLYLPRLLYGLPLVPLALLALCTDRRLLLVLGGCLLFLLGPVAGWNAPGRGAAARGGAVRLRVVTLNAGAGSDAVAALMRVVGATSPDVVVAQESPSYLPELFSGWSTHKAGEFFMASRLPLLEAQERSLQPNAPWRTAVRYRL